MEAEIAAIQEEYLEFEENGDDGISVLVWVYVKYIMIVLNVLLACFIFYKSRSPKPQKENVSSVVLVIAHPDDEAMFFAPLITSLVQQKRNIFVLCLSNGNFYGLGKIREKELVESCKYLGISSNNVEVIDHSDLQDGMKSNWSKELIASIVQEYVTKNNCDTIVTFDQHGVSSHPNHIATHFGVMEAKKSLEKVRVFTLETTNILRKYIGPFDFFFSVWDSLYFSFLPIDSYASMKKHYSQFVWFRRLFVIFSRYGYINTFTEIE